MDSCQTSKAVASVKLNKQPTEHRPGRIPELGCDQSSPAYGQSLWLLVSCPSELKILVEDEHICKFLVCYVRISFKNWDLVSPNSPLSASGPGRMEAACLGGCPPLKRQQCMHPCSREMGGPG